MKTYMDESIEIEGTGNDWSDNIILDTCDKYLKKDSDEDVKR